MLQQLFLLALVSATQSWSTDDNAASRHMLRQANGFFTSTLTLNPQLIYNINVTIGNPPQPATLVFDTGSGNIWVPSFTSNVCKNSSCQGIAFNPNISTSFHTNGANVTIPYGSAVARGTVFTDQFMIGGALVQNLTMDLVSNVSGQNNGVLGVYPATPQPGLLDGLLSSGQISRRAFSLYLNSYASGVGSVTFGGIDSSKYTGPLTSLALTPNQTGGYDRYRVDLTGVNFVDPTGQSKPVLSTTMNAPVVLDSGFGTLVLPDNLTTAVATGLGAILSNDGSTYFIDCALQKSNASFSFQFGGSSGPIIKAALSELIIKSGNFSFKNGVSGCNLLFSPPGYYTPAALGGYTLGAPFLRNAYVVYDVDNHQVSLAQAVLGMSGSGAVVAIPKGTGLPGASSTVTALATNLPLNITSTVTASTNNITVTGSVLLTTLGMPTFPVTPAMVTTAAPTTTFTGIASKMQPMAGFTCFTVIVAMAIAKFFVMSMFLVL